MRGAIVGLLVVAVVVALFFAVLLPYLMVHDGFPEQCASQGGVIIRDWWMQWCSVTVVGGHNA